MAIGGEVKVESSVARIITFYRGGVYPQDLGRVLALGQSPPGKLA
jgi:hypothetical protein